MKIESYHLADQKSTWESQKHINSVYFFRSMMILLFWTFTVSTDFMENQFVLFLLSLLYL